MTNPTAIEVRWLAIYLLKINLVKFSGENMQFSKALINTQRHHAWLDTKDWIYFLTAITGLDEKQLLKALKQEKYPPNMPGFVIVQSFIGFLEASKK